MGMPLYLQQPPTGYKDTASAWVSTSGLLARLNFALDLAGNRIPGIAVDPRLLLEGSALARLSSGLSETSRRSIEREGDALDPARRVGLLLGSPEFQRR
jgi:uncharacterized protein (DUF1800 family)